VARIVEISATSTTSFEHAIQSGIDRATETLRQVKSAWIKDQRVEVQGSRITAYQVNLLVTFVLENDERPVAEPW
jgi:flavin-binding protein dodecin